MSNIHKFLRVKPFLLLGVLISFLSNQMSGQDSLRYAEESHLRNIRQLTFGGDNAEAYWSYDGKSLVFQRTSLKDGIPCDQIFVGRVPENAASPFEFKLVSTGKGRTLVPFSPRIINISFMPLRIWLAANVRQLRIEQSMAINTFGHYTEDTIFSKLISMEKL